MPRWIRLTIPIGSLIFILALAGSAMVVPQLRLLHLLQAFIYVVIMILARRNSPWIFGVAIFIATAWNSLNLFVTHFFAKGAALFWDFILTGHVSHPETIMVFIASLAHFMLIVACTAAIARLRPDKRQWYHFFAGGLLVLVYMAAIIMIAAPR
jgi:hypothetical protein